MGNRAIVKPVDKNIGVYLHWNGSIESVSAFLEYCKLKDYRDFGGKYADGYGIARFCQVVGNFFGGGLSIGIETDVTESEEMAEWMDNGIYVIDGWDICRRIGAPDDKQPKVSRDMLLHIDQQQPEKEQLGESYILADVVEPSELEIGDRVFLLRYEGKPETYTVMGFAPEGTIRNGSDVSGVPYVDMYGKDGDYSWNINNYLRGMVRKEGRKV